MDTLVIQLNSLPEIESILDTTVCNINEGTSTSVLNLSALVVGDDGSWTDEMGIVIDDPQQVDFENEEIGSTHIFIFTTNTAIDPCEDVTYSLLVTVVDCNCDDPVFLDPPDLCNGEGEAIDLSDLLLSEHVGEWEFVSGPIGSIVNISESIFDANNIFPGIYEIKFTVTENLENVCQAEWMLFLSISAQLTAELESLVEICTTNENEEETITDLNGNILPGSIDLLTASVVGYL